MGHIRVDPPNTNNKWVGFGLANVDTFIIRVGFGLANVDTIRALTRHEHNSLTRIVIPTVDPWLKAKWTYEWGIGARVAAWANTFIWLRVI